MMSKKCMGKKNSICPNIQINTKLFDKKPNLDGLSGK